MSVVSAGRLVRAPDQFRPSRDRPMAATPTCCCCCCCCISTFITSAIVLPMSVELMNRGPRAPHPPLPRDRVVASKWIIGMGPIVAFAAGLTAAIGWRNAWLGAIVAIVILLASAAYAYAPFGRGATSIVTAVAVAFAFAVEFVIGFFGLLFTAGVGYLAFAVLLPVLTTKAFQSRLARYGSGGPGGPFGPGLGSGGGPPPPPYAPPPPPLPRPPSSNE